MVPPLEFSSRRKAVYEPENLSLGRDRIASSGNEVTGPSSRKRGGAVILLGWCGIEVSALLTRGSLEPKPREEPRLEPGDADRDKNASLSSGSLAASISLKLQRPWAPLVKDKS